MVWASVSSDAHRLEGAGADMQRDARGGDAGVGERGQQLGREMQAGGGRGDRAVVAGEQGLVVGAVLRIGHAAADVGRQRHRAALLEGCEEARARRVEGEDDRAVLVLGLDRGAEAPAKAMPSPGRSRLVGRAKESQRPPPRSRISSASTATSCRPAVPPRTP